MSCTHRKPRGRIACKACHIALHDAGVGPTSLTVPGKPIGTNAAYKRRFMAHGGGGLMKTKEAKAWQASIAAYGAAARGEREALEGPCVTTVRIYFENELPDIDGPIKLLLDALQSPRDRKTKRTRKTIRVPGAGLYRNDRQIRELHVYRDTDAERPRVEVEVSPLRSKL